MDIKKFIELTSESLMQYNGKKTISALSGGIDSALASVLVNNAIGKENLKCVYVDTGLMRYQDREDVEAFAKKFDLDLEVVEAKGEFMSRLRGITEPEEKRKVIGHLFIEIFERMAKQHGAQYLVQGTVAPDWIESGEGRETIKSHHNVGGLPKKMGLILIEPIRDLYKHEVRECAKFLGFPKNMLTMQPFPGPGLAIRILGEITEERADMVRKATRIVEEEVEKAMDNLPWQYFASLFPIRTVGVKGDERAYHLTVVVRIVESIDAMTANFSRMDYGVLQTISTRIINEIPDVGRVVYDITNKPPGTIEFE